VQSQNCHLNFGPGLAEGTEIVDVDYEWSHKYLSSFFPPLSYLFAVELKVSLRGKLRWSMNKRTIRN
jgi:hypothetical protein